MPKFLILAGAMLLAQAAYAAEAGKVIFVAGAARIAERAATLDAAVEEGALLSTGGDGYIYIKTIDDGLFILRPNTQARIASYHIDAANPANTRIKLELLSGVARSQSGKAVKQARQNFRFNTPVAAIGVRGTDFTVFTDRDTSRVTVLSGGITMSGFAGGCSPDGTGPCEGGAARELFAAQKGQLLQVQRGQAAPQLLQGSTAIAPDLVVPPRGDEPGRNGGTAAVEPSLDGRKDAALKTQIQSLNLPPTTPVTKPDEPNTTAPTVPPEVVVTPPETPTPVEPVPVVLKTVSWGRWAPVANRAANSGVSLDGADRIALNDNYVLFRSKAGSNYTAPEKGSVSFAMASGEAAVRDLSLQTQSVAALENGKLSFNFDNATFTTQVDVLNGGDRFTLANSGRLGKDAVFSATNKYNSSANMNVTGVLQSEKSATYLFDALLDARRKVSGITVWGK